MTATNWGKVLVTVNVVFSLMLAGIALAIYANRMDWPGVAPGSQRQANNYPSKKADVESAQKAAAIGTGRYDEAKADLEKLEKLRPERNAIYASNLQPLESGPSPVMDISRQAKTGIPILAPDGLPTLKPSNPPLQSRQDYQRAIADVEANIATTIQQTRQAIDEEQKRTEELNGSGQQAGLRDLLREERVAKEKALAELRYLQPLRYNFQVESVLLDKRQRSLQERLQELDRLGMAFQRP
jgi:hypothetical protein